MEIAIAGLMKQALNRAAAGSSVLLQAQQLTALYRGCKANSWQLLIAQMPCTAAVLSAAALTAVRACFAWHTVLFWTAYTV